MWKSGDWPLNGGPRSQGTKIKIVLSALIQAELSRERMNSIRADAFVTGF